MIPLVIPAAIVWLALARPVTIHQPVWCMDVLSARTGKVEQVCWVRRKVVGVVGGGAVVSSK